MTEAPLVTLNDVAVRVGSRIIWSGAHASLPAGSFMAVLGPNGAGKSTLLRALLGLTPVFHGSISIFGVPPRRGNPAIGYVPQRRAFDHDLAVRGRDLVRLGLDGAQWGVGIPGRTQQNVDVAVNRAIADVEATTYADQPIGQLSGGEQQRLLLAQALVSTPRLLLLDEPLASLDVRHQIAIAQLVKKVAQQKGIAVVMVTHDINPVLPLVDQVMYVAQGRVAVGTPKDIIKTDVLSDLYGAPVEVIHDSHGHIFVVGLENEIAHPHDHAHAHGAR